MPQTVEPAPPPFNVRLHNARLAAGRVLTRALRGGHLGVSSVETDRRLKICDACSRLRHSDWVCAECGCFIKLKATLTTEVCALGKWADLPPTTAQPVLLLGEQLLGKELELRVIVPPEHFMIQTFNKYHEENLNGGCYSCRRKAYGRTLAAALQEFLAAASADDVVRIRALFPNTTHIEGIKVSRAWSTISKGSSASG